jgi:MoaA/NifB/PqqE/SkfB family radical SAM enzyme
VRAGSLLKKTAAEPAPRSGRPPGLAGYTFSAAESAKARRSGALLTVSLEINRTCNLRCRYCYAGGRAEARGDANVALLRDLIRQAAEAKAVSVVLTGGGEPTLHPRVRDLVSEIRRAGMIPVVSTNAVGMDRGMAAFLYGEGASVLAKLDSLDAATQDFLAGRPGTFDDMQVGLTCLLDAGFTRTDDTGRLRLGLACVACRANVHEIRDIWSFCRSQNIFPCIENLVPAGRARGTMSDQVLDPREVQKYRDQLLDLDRNEYGFQWVPHTPLPAAGCLQPLHGLYITVDGNARPCAAISFDEHPSLCEGAGYPYNVHRVSLRQIWNSPLFRAVRRIDKRLGGRCGRCRFSESCIGCRGCAYVTGIAEGLAPLEALRTPCRHCLASR